MALHVPLVGLLRSDDLLVGLIGETLGGGQVGVAACVYVLDRGMLGERDADSGNAETKEGYGKGLAKIHGEFLRRESYAHNQRRVKQNLQAGDASFGSWDERTKLGKSVMESEGQSWGGHWRRQ
jgi:hypothetical protein